MLSTKKSPVMIVMRCSPGCPSADKSRHLNHLIITPRLVARVARRVMMANARSAAMTFRFVSVAIKEHAGAFKRHQVYAAESEVGV